MIRIVKVVNYTRTYVSKVDGKEYPTIGLYLAIPKVNANGEVKEKFIAIKPRFETSAKRDLYDLESVAEVKKVLPPASGEETSNQLKEDHAPKETNGSASEKAKDKKRRRHERSE